MFSARWTSGDLAYIIWSINQSDSQHGLLQCLFFLPCWLSWSSNQPEILIKKSIQSFSIVIEHVRFRLSVGSKEKHAYPLHPPVNQIINPSFKTSSIDTFFWLGWLIDWLFGWFCLCNHFRIDEPLNITLSSMSSDWLMIDDRWVQRSTSPFEFVSGSNVCSMSTALLSILWLCEDKWHTNSDRW